MQKSIHEILYPSKALNLLSNTKVLIIGVGGIGCQILKVISKLPLAAIHIVDMDTIQASNLNRQFLFKQHHSGQSKSLTAKSALLEINSSLKITSHHLNIKELSIGFFKQFDFLVMALDNVDARNYVNKVGVRLGVPIIDAGTLGYKGNANVIIPGKTKCYACQEKSIKQTVFPVCTIRSRPEKPIHCVTWAKLLFEVFFGVDNETNDLNDLKELLKNADQQMDNNGKQAYLIMTKLFHQEIEGLKHLKSQVEEEKDKEGQAYINFSKKLKPIGIDVFQQANENQEFCINNFQDFDKTLSTATNARLFKWSYNRLEQQKKKDGFIVFQKDDDAIIHFISSAANLRMECFSIQCLNFYQIKNMAGNIIPAIASTNSIVSGLQITEMMKIIFQKSHFLKSYFVQNLSTKVIPMKLQQPSPLCKICSQDSIPVIIETDLRKFTCGDLVKVIKNQCGDFLDEFSINLGQDEVYNSEDGASEQVLRRSISQMEGVRRKQQQGKPNQINEQGGNVEFLLTDETKFERVCNVWVVQTEGVQETEVRLLNPEQFRVRQKQTNMMQESNSNLDKGAQLEPKGNYEKYQSDSDDLVFMDECNLQKDNQSDEIQIIEVKKRNNDEMKMDIEEEELIQVKKQLKKH